MNAQPQTLLEKTDKKIFGFILGLIMPMLMFYVYYALKYNQIPWTDYVTQVKDLSVLPKVIRICTIVNLPVLLAFNFTKQFNVCIGLFAASMIYVAGMIIVLFVL